MPPQRPKRTPFPPGPRASRDRHRGTRDSVPLGQRHDALFTPTNCSATVHVIRLPLNRACGQRSVPLAVPARVPRSFASRSEVPQHPVEPSANHRASVRGNHRPPLATPPRRDHFSPRARLPKGHGCRPGSIPGEDTEILTLEPDGTATGCNPVEVGSTPTGVSDRPTAGSDYILVRCDCPNHSFVGGSLYMPNCSPGLHPGC